MAYRDTSIGPMEFLKLIMTLRRNQMIAPVRGVCVTVVAGCQGYILRPEEAAQPAGPDAASRLAAWPGHPGNVSQ